MTTEISVMYGSEKVNNMAVQSQNAPTAYFSSEQLLHFDL